jgi:hypothetical protein
LLGDQYFSLIHGRLPHDSYRRDTVSSHEKRGSHAASKVAADILQRSALRFR